jgi:hypothetical protein
MPLILIEEDHEYHDGWVIREYLFNCLQLVELIYGTRGSSGAVLSRETGAGD